MLCACFWTEQHVHRNKETVKLSQVMSNLILMVTNRNLFFRPWNSRVAKLNLWEIRHLIVNLNPASLLHHTTHTKHLKTADLLQLSRTPVTKGEKEKKTLAVVIKTTLHPDAAFLPLLPPLGQLQAFKCSPHCFHCQPLIRSSFQNCSSSQVGPAWPDRPGQTALLCPH